MRCIFQLLGAALLLFPALRVLGPDPAHASAPRDFFFTAPTFFFLGPDPAFAQNVNAAPMLVLGACAFASPLYAGPAARGAVLSWLGRLGTTAAEREAAVVPRSPEIARDHTRSR